MNKTVVVVAGALMSLIRRIHPLFAYSVVLSLCALAGNLHASPVARALVTRPINDQVLHALAGQTRPEANAANDRGRVSDDLVVEHMQLELRRPPEREMALRQLIDSEHDARSPQFHHWLTAQELGRDYGPSPDDLQTVASWLEARGFTVNAIYASGLTLDFTGTAGAISRTFHTELHHLDVGGRQHIANMSDPQIPVALADAVAGVVSLHDFTPRPLHTERAEYTFARNNNTNLAITPGDLAAIYNLNPLFASGVTGVGQTIALIEDTDLYNSGDWNSFRAAFGLSQYASGSLTTVHPRPQTGANNCGSPGVVAGDDSEAILDAEWASAAAPDAAIVLASCANTHSTFGGFIALQNLLNAENPPPIISLSYGSCEAEMGAAANAAVNALYEQAAAEGVSIYVSAGDEGAASCDAGASGATHGIGVSGFASTPYNVAVGGTDFGDTAAGTSSLYWSATNSDTYASAISYIPEIPWNDSCASTLLAQQFGYAATFGATGFCGSAAARQNGFLVVAAGSGGPSGCAAGGPATSSVVSGTCKGYAKPSWQAGVAGIPDDGVRDLPDVSMFAADGVWGHFYVYCWSDVRNGGAACKGAPSTWSGAGGTSFGAPILAGVQALVNQFAGGRQGNPNPTYYALAQQTANCAATGNCVFHAINQGDIDVNCSGTHDCFGASTSTGGRSSRNGTQNGALSTSTSSFLPAFAAGSAWNFATGLGSIDAWQLVMNWGSAQQ